MSKTTAVWVYKRSGEETGSLDLSIKTAKAFLSGVDGFVVCGDKPPEGVQWIDSPLVTQSVYQEKTQNRYAKRWRKWVDSVHKLQAIIDSPLVGDSFLWLYDDSFFLKPVNVEEFRTPIYSGTLGGTLARKHRKSNWRRCRLRSANALRDHGLPALDFSTHAPILFEKEKLQKTIDLFECYTRPRVIESMYGNQWFGASARKAQHAKGLFRYITDGTLSGSKLVNVGNGHLHRHRDEIESRLGQPAP